MPINFHELCRNVAEKEGKKKSVDIAQISEVVSLVFAELATHTVQDVASFISHQMMRHGAIVPVLSEMFYTDKKPELSGDFEKGPVIVIPLEGGKDEPGT